MNADEILAELDGDTRAYLQILLNAGGTAFDDKATGADKRFQQTAEQDLRETFKRFEPTARDGEQITRLLIERRHNIRHVIHNFQQLSTALGATATGSSRASWTRRTRTSRRSRQQESSLRERAALVPGRARRRPTTTLTEDERAGRRARPGARSGCGRSRASWRPRSGRRSPFFRETTPIIRDQIRPFARDVQPTVRDLRARPTTSPSSRRG